MLRVTSLENHGGKDNGAMRRINKSDNVLKKLMTVIDVQNYNNYRQVCSARTAASHGEN